MQHPDFTWQLARERQARRRAEAGRSRRTDDASSAVGRVTGKPSFARVAGAHVDEQFSALSVANAKPAGQLTITR